MLYQKYGDGGREKKQCLEHVGMTPNFAVSKIWDHAVWTLKQYCMTYTLQESLLCEVRSLLGKGNKSNKTD